MYLSKSEIDALDLQIARVHAATGVRVVAAEIGKADVYEELPWKAFALGASLAALGADRRRCVCPQWATRTLDAAIGGRSRWRPAQCAALLAIFVPAFGRLFLHGARCEVEVGQYAQALFLRRELFKAPNRSAILVLVSRFERRVHILPDTGIAGLDRRRCVAGRDREDEAGAAAGASAEALQAGTPALEELLVRSGHKGAARQQTGRPIR